MAEFQYYFAQREALESIIYLYDVVDVKDKYDLMRFDSSGLVSAGMFDETWRRFVVKMATGTGKTKVAESCAGLEFLPQVVRARIRTWRGNFLVIAPTSLSWTYLQGLSRAAHPF